MPERRGEALAAVFLIAYAGMTLPPLLAAGALSIWSPVTVLIGLSALAGLLVVVSGARMACR
jgi:hypothetical protein